MPRAGAGPSHTHRSKDKPVPRTGAVSRQWAAPTAPLSGGQATKLGRLPEGTGQTGAASRKWLSQPAI